MSTIPASSVTNINPGVLSTGGGALALLGMFLTTNSRVPIGTVQSFASAAAVQDFFGAGNETDKATIYFNSFTNKTKTPGSLNFAQYPATAVGAYLRGGNVSALTLANLQALNGTLTMTVDGSEQTGTANLAPATSFSNAAEIIETALNSDTTFTASIDANVVVGRIDPNVGTGSIAGTTMTISAVTTGAYAPGQTVTGTGVANGTQIVSQLTGTAGSTGTYQLNTSQTVASTTLTGSGGCLNVSAITTGTLDVGQTLSGSGVTSGTKITNFLTGTGGTGKYAVDKSQTVAPSTTITATGGTMTVSAVSAGTIGLGDVIVGAGVTLGNHVTKFISGTGTTGTYFVSVGDTVGSEAMTISGASVDVTYDSVSGAFNFASSTTGASSTVTFATGTLSASLKLTAVTGAVLSQGAIAAAPGTFMDALVQTTQNWAAFTTLFNPDAAGEITNRLAFAAWVSAQNGRYVYVVSDDNVEPTTTVPATSSLGYAVTQAGYSGVNLNYEPSDTGLTAFVCGMAASINFDIPDGRITADFRSQAGLVAGVTNLQTAVNLAGNPQTAGDFGNGYNFYGAYATANNGWVYYTRGTVSGAFKWLDTYLDQIWLNNFFLVVLMNYLTSVNSVPYNQAGYSAIRVVLQGPISQALSAGVIRAGVTLSSSQIAQLNAVAPNAASTVQNQGWFLQIVSPPADVRQSRGSPTINFYYTDGESVQAISFASIVVQ